MEMRHGMPVWAPSDLELAAIAKRVSRERAKAAKQMIVTARQILGDS